ncbi:hypothetical protein GCM10010420_31100 [Streptomyces glaucosporus]|uniref:Integrase n=1 Tax=Streptomyces glaucosporus TaxID=284044 RepID=A0ABN3IDP2_9ACTN
MGRSGGQSLGSRRYRDAAEQGRSRRRGRIIGTGGLPGRAGGDRPRRVRAVRPSTEGRGHRPRVQQHRGLHPQKSNFTLGAELGLTVGLWESQLKTLLQSCAHISNHLDYSAKAYAKEDDEIAAQMRHRSGAAMSVSEIEKFYK